MNPSSLKHGAQTPEFDRLKSEQEKVGPAQFLSF
jgi:hypothetical protein